MTEGPGGWAASGAMDLTGDPDGPPLAPAGDLTGALDRAADELRHLCGVEVDGPALLGERAALLGLRRAGRRSCGGSTRLLRTADGWVAVALPRPEDLAAVPALLQDATTEGCDPWTALETGARRWPAAELAEQAALLSLPLGVVPERDRPASDGAPWTAVGAEGRERALSGLRVADLASLWAGPLCTSLLAAGGAQVTKVESVTRPDGARRGDPTFWALLNGAKAERSVDVAALADEAAAADIVVLGARRRAYEQLGLDIEAILAAGTDKVVVGITGHGWPDDRVGFGDDAAAAAGLVAWHPIDDRPRFLADAVADPATGLFAALAAARCATAGGRWFVDISLAGVSRWLATQAATHLPAVAATRDRDGWSMAGQAVAPARARTIGGTP